MKKRVIIVATVCCLLLGVGLITSATEPKTFTPGEYYSPVVDNYYVTKERVTAVPNTVEAWICLDSNLDADSRGGVIVGNYDGDTDATYSVEVFSGMHPRVLLINNNGEAQSYVFHKVSLDVGEFVHLSIVRDTVNSKMHCYVGGELKQSLDLYGDQSITLDSLMGVGGDFKDKNTTAFLGEINSVVLFEDARTAEEIQADMNVVEASAEGLVANWSFDAFTPGDIAVADLKGTYGLVQKAEWADEFDVGEYDYTIALVGDTQWLNYYHSGNYMKLYQWLVDQKGELTIKAVLGLGDITESTKDAEWERAGQAGKLMADNNLPYTMIVGNHDLDSFTRTQFDNTFPVRAFKDNGFFKGSYEENSISNAYYEIKMGNTDYLIFGLEYGPRDGVLEWAGKIIEDNPDKNVIITTHAYIMPDGEYVMPGYTGGSPAPSGLQGGSDALDGTYGPYGTDGNDGDDIWNKLASKYKNISMVICGHTKGNLVVQQKIGEQGNIVTDVLCDATSLDTTDSSTGGAGAVCLLHIKESADGKHEVLPVLYSTIKGQYYKPTYQQAFTMYGTSGTE